MEKLLIITTKRAWRALAIFSCLVFITSSVFSSPASAVDNKQDDMPAYYDYRTNGLEYNPPTIKPDITAGEIYRDTIDVTNISDKPITVKVYVRPYTAGNSEYSVSFDTQTSESKITDWTFILNNSESGITIQPGSTASIDFVIDTPKDIDTGRQSEAIFFEHTEPNQHGAKTSFGVTIFANVVKPFSIQPIIIAVIVAVTVLALFIILISIFTARRKIKKGN